MTTPTPGSQIDVSDVNVELAYSSSQETNLNKNIVRQLTNQQSKQLAGAELLLGSDLSNKTAFESVYSAVSSNVVTAIYYISEGPVTSSLTLTANSDLYSPTVDWSWIINNDSVRVSNDNLSITTSGKNATITLATTSGERSANLTVFANVIVDGHSVGTLSKNIRLTANVFDQGLLVTASPSTSINNVGVKPQTGTITLKASSSTQLNPSLLRYRFTPLLVSGTQLSPAIGLDKITFSIESLVPSVNQSSYSVLTELLYQDKVIGTDTTNVSLRTEFIKRDITSLTTPGGVTSNNNFANDSSQYATLDVTAIHNSIAPTYSQGTITFSYESSGDPITTQVISSSSSSTTTRISLFHNFNTDGFGFKKATVNVIATLTDPTGYVMDVKRINGLILRTGAYGLSITPPQSITQTGYAAQTAVTSGSATWRVGNLSWSQRSFNVVGSLPSFSEQPQSNRSNITLTASTPSGKNASQAIVSSANFDLTTTVTYDGVIVAERTINDVLVKAESLAYTYNIISPASSNVVIDNDNSITSSITTTASHNIPGGSVQWAIAEGSSIGTVTNSSSANVFVTSPGSGGTNNQFYILRGTLVDSSARAVESLTTARHELDATTLKLQILGDPTVNLSQSNVPTTAVANYEAISVAGTPIIVYPPTKLSGSDLNLVQDSSTKVRIIATSVGATVSGIYSVLAKVNYRSQSRDVTKIATVSATVTSTTINVVKNTSNATKSSYLSPQTATVTFSATTDLAGGTLKPVILQPTDGSASVTISGSNVTISLTRTSEGTSTVDCKVIYELRDSNGTFIRDNSADVGSTTATLSATVSAPNFAVSDAVISSKQWVFVNIDPSIPLGSSPGNPHPHPRYAYYYQTQQYSASFPSDIPNSRVVYNVADLPAFIDFSYLATSTTTTSGVGGQVLTANASAGYYDYFDGANQSNDRFIKSDYNANYSVNGELFTNNTKLGSSITKAGQYNLQIPAGRIFDLTLHLYNAGTYGPRMYWTRDSRGNRPPQWNFGSLPGFNTYSGGACKWLGFHSQTATFPNQVSGYGYLYDPNAGTSRPRPLYNSSGVRFYSSENHRIMFGENPAVVIPNYYFMVLGFQDPRLSNPVDVFLIGSDQNLYGPLKLWASSGANYVQNDTSRDNDGFQWWIFEMFPYPGVTFTHCIISNGPTGIQGIIPGVGVNPPIILNNQVLDPVEITDPINILLGTVSGGSTINPTQPGSGGGIFDRDFWDNVKLV